jgi:hypothetical protein
VIGAQSASAVEISTPGCGVTEFPTSSTGSWAIPGGGVNVFSNGSSHEGTGVDCTSGTSTVNGKAAGEKWQCVEFINRLYLTKGWISSTWRGDAGPAFYDNAPSNLTKQTNGAVSYLGPGDVVVINVFFDGSSDGGHALVVNDNSHVSSGTVNLVSQNSGFDTNSEPVVSGTIRNGSVTVGGGGGGYTYSTVGVVHAPSGGSSGSSGGGGGTSNTHAETTGSVVHTWTNYSDAGGTEGPSIPSNDTVQITCKVTGFAVADGNTAWYQVGSSPWSNSYYASADAFYNNGQTSGSLAGTPFVDNNVPNCSSSGATPTPAPTPTPVQAPTYAETSGSVVHTWTNYSDAGGTEGPSIPSNDTVQITCKVTGFAVADGNTAWYQVGSSPWSNSYYASADAFYNNGQTSGSLAGTPFVDNNVPNC